MGEWEWHEILDDMMMMIMRWQFFPVAMTDKSVCGFWLLWNRWNVFLGFTPLDAFEIWLIQRSESGF